MYNTIIIQQILYSRITQCDRRLKEKIFSLLLSYVDSLSLLSHGYYFYLLESDFDPLLLIIHLHFTSSKWFHQQDGSCRLEMWLSLALIQILFNENLIGIHLHAIFASMICLLAKIVERFFEVSPTFLSFKTRPQNSLVNSTKPQMFSFVPPPPIFHHLPLHNITIVESFFRNYLEKDRGRRERSRKKFILLIPKFY